MGHIMIPHLDTAHQPARRAQSSSSTTSTHASTTSTSSTKTSATASATSTSTAGGASGQAKIVHWATIVGICLAGFLFVASVVVGVRTFRAKRRKRRDKAGLAAATAAALSMGSMRTEKRQGSGLSPSPSSRTRSRSPMRDTTRTSPQQGWDDAMSLPTRTTTPGPLTPGFSYRDSTTLLPMYQSPRHQGSIALPSTPNSSTFYSANSRQTAARGNSANTYPPTPTHYAHSQHTESADELGYAQQQSHAQALPAPRSDLRPSEDSAHPGDTSGSSLPNPFAVGTAAVAVAERRTHAPPEIMIPRSRDVEAEMAAGPAVPPSPSQWLSRSPVNSAYFPPGETAGSANLSAAVQSLDEDSDDGEWEEDGLFAQMMGLQDQLEAGAAADARDHDQDQDKNRIRIVSQVGSAQHEGAGAGEAL
ncbi:hypothetical protein FIBSPDRAFT_893842 [Athelia psychrophila]|uniref:Uncharacterized protein n=1 Tax=Athelia psychrophila TaxID=1759441 RepID=A0A166GKZ6_9AGAM|nr:hypothetical protein FIBSPDRAFT_893842 [Fibularhizoctonia sp. CBS 109695]